VPQYPEIELFRNNDEKAEHELRLKVKGFKTVEEKQWYVNCPKYFGWRTYCMDSARIPPSALPSIQFVTNTTLVADLPAVYRDLEAKSMQVAESLAPSIKAALAFHAIQHEMGVGIANDRVEFHEHGAVSQSFKTKTFDKNSPAVNAVNRIIMSFLTGGGGAKKEVDHLQTATLDHQPRNEAFWFRGPMDPSAKKVVHRLGTVYGKGNKASRKPKTREWAEKTQYDYPFQFTGSYIHCQLRCQKALPPLLALDDPLVLEGEVGKHDYQPGWSGWRINKRRHGTNLVGTWTGTDTSFAHLALVDNMNLEDNDSTSNAWADPDSELNQRQEMLLSKLILNGFGMNFAQACNQGFSPFNDPQRPFVGQVAVTDGQHWKLGVYQLNKMAMQGISETSEEMLRNVCWHLPEQKLYADIDLESGEVVDLNLGLLSDIVKLYMMRPTTSEAEIPNQGYLEAADKRHVHQLKNQYNRESFTQAFRHMYSNRPRAFNLEYGQIQWHERLLNIRHKSLPHNTIFGNREMPWFVRAQYDKRGREYWHPEYRWYDNHPGRYVPAKFRKENPKAKRAPVLTAPLPPDDE